MARLFSKKSLVEVIGVDYEILEQVGETGNIKKFYYAGGLILLIFCCTFVSIFYAFDLMWHTWSVQIVLATVFSLTLGTIYILLLQSFSKNPLPRTDKPLRLGFSNVSRAAFILFIGFLIAKPIEVLILKPDADRHIERYKLQLISDYERAISGLYAHDIHLLKQKIRMYESLSGDPASLAQVAHWRNEIEQNEQFRDESIDRATVKIQKADFFIERVQFVVTAKRSAWVICGCIVFLFGLPAALIYSISKDNVYYQRKSALEKEFVMAWYTTFKTHYQNRFEAKFRVEVKFHEPYINPPFGIERPEQAVFKPQDDFFKDFPDFS